MVRKSGAAKKKTNKTSQIQNGSLKKEQVNEIPEKSQAQTRSEATTRQLSNHLNFNNRNNLEKPIEIKKKIVKKLLPQKSQKKPKKMSAKLANIENKEAKQQVKYEPKTKAQSKQIIAHKETLDKALLTNQPTKITTPKVSTAKVALKIYSPTRKTSQTKVPPKKSLSVEPEKMKKTKVEKIVEQIEKEKENVTQMKSTGKSNQKIENNSKTSKKKPQLSEQKTKVQEKIKIENPRRLSKKQETEKIDQMSKQSDKQRKESVKQPLEQQQKLKKVKELEKNIKEQKKKSKSQEKDLKELENKTKELEEKFVEPKKKEEQTRKPRKKPEKKSIQQSEVIEKKLPELTDKEKLTIKSDEEQNESKILIKSGNKTKSERKEKSNERKGVISEQKPKKVEEVKEIPESVYQNKDSIRKSQRKSKGSENKPVVRKSEKKIIKENAKLEIKEGNQKEDESLKIGNSEVKKREEENQERHVETPEKAENNNKKGKSSKKKYPMSAQNKDSTAKKGKLKRNIEDEEPENLEELRDEADLQDFVEHPSQEDIDDIPQHFAENLFNLEEEQILEKKDQVQEEENRSQQQREGADDIDNMLLENKFQQVESPKDQKTINKIAKAEIIDVVFCCDTTFSMIAYLDQTKETVKTIIKNIDEKFGSEAISVMFGFVCYRDHPPQDDTYVTKVRDLCTDEEVIKFIEQQTAEGGGDYPEAVLDGLFDSATKISWRESNKTTCLKYIFHIADAPPHGKEFGVESLWSDGVPYSIIQMLKFFNSSGVNLDKLSHEMNFREIHYRLIDVNGQQLKRMAELFKEKFTNYEQTSLSNANELKFKVTDMILHELLNDLE